MALDPAELPDDVGALKPLLIAADRRTRDLGAEIESLKLTIAKLQHDRFGPSSERARLLDQLELQLGELIEHVGQTATTDEIAVAQAQMSQSDDRHGPTNKPPRRTPARRPLPETLPQRQLARYAGIMQVDAYSGYNALYAESRRPGPIVEATCWADGRRKLYELARLSKMPIAIEAVRRIDDLFAIEREINGLPPEQRMAARRERSKPLDWSRQRKHRAASTLIR
jgi:hypothetical protein